MSQSPERFLGYLQAERNAVLLYRALADTVDGERREALLELAEIEEHHAAHWEEKLTEYGIAIPPMPTQLDPDDQGLIARARAAGLDGVLRTLEETEGAASGMYDQEPEAPVGMSDDERNHAEALRLMREDPEALMRSKRVLRPGSGEPQHRLDRSGAVRASVFGISDGLVSNTALVMGFAGAAPGSKSVLFAGLAGLLAGAFSMAAGEYVSVASQRDLFAREIALEAAELDQNPQEEAKELELIYRAKGLSREQARTVANTIIADPKLALETLAREELGLDPDSLGSPVKVAVSSFISFAIGASVVVLPYLFASGTAALVTAITLSILAMIVVGASVGRFSGRNVLVSIGRQVGWGVGAAVFTFAIGRLIGVHLG